MDLQIATMGTAESLGFFAKVHHGGLGKVIRPSKWGGGSEQSRTTPLTSVWCLRVHSMLLMSVSSNERAPNEPSSFVQPDLVTVLWSKRSHFNTRLSKVDSGGVVSHWQLKLSVLCTSKDSIMSSKRPIFLPAQTIQS